MSSYCSKCGKELGEGTRFCPMCGFDTMGQGSGNNYNQNTGPQHNSNQSPGMGGTLSIIFVCGALWAIFALLVGIAFMPVGAAIYYVAGTIAIIVGILLFLSALFTVLCCVKLYRLENFQQASTYCLIGSILAIPFLVGILGVIFYFLMQKERSRFKS